MSGTTPPTQIGGTILESGIWTALNDAGHAGNSSSETGGSDSEDEEIDVVTSNDDDDPFLLSRQKLRSIKPGDKKCSIYSRQCCHIWRFIVNLATFETIWLPKFSLWLLVLFGYFFGYF